MVLAGDARQRLAERRLVQAVLLGVRRGQEGERGGSRHGRLGSVSRRRTGRGEAGIAGVLEFLDADRHDQVVGAAGHRVRGVADRLAACSAEILDARDRLVGNLQRFGEQQARQAARQRPHPVRIDLLPLDLRRGAGLERSLHQQVPWTAVPVLAEARAAHADDGDAVADSVAGHGDRPSCV